MKRIKALADKIFPIDGSLPDDKYLAPEGIDQDGDLERRQQLRPGADEEADAEADEEADAEADGSAEPTATPEPTPTPRADADRRRRATPAAGALTAAGCEARERRYVRGRCLRAGPTG